MGTLTENKSRAQTFESIAQRAFSTIAKTYLAVGAARLHYPVIDGEGTVYFLNKTHSGALDIAAMMNVGKNPAEYAVGPELKPGAQYNMFDEREQDNKKSYIHERPEAEGGDNMHIKRGR